MKNKLKLFGIVAVVAVIGFSMVGCDNGNNGGGGGATVTVTFTFESEELIITWRPNDYDRLRRE